MKANPAQKRLNAAARAGDLGGVRAALAEAPWRPAPHWKVCIEDFGTRLRPREHALFEALREALRSGQWRIVFYLNDVGAPLDYLLRGNRTAITDAQRSGPIPGNVLVELGRRGANVPERSKELRAILTPRTSKASRDRVAHGRRAFAKHLRLVRSGGFETRSHVGGADAPLIGMVGAAP